jgi:HK97 family phage prohead protease
MPPEKRSAPPNWRAGTVETRSTRSIPTSYDAAAHTIECVFSTGATVTRWWGSESILISDEAIDKTRVLAGQVKALDSHNAYCIDAILGTVESVRVENGALIGVIKFAETEDAQAAEGMVARGELTGISIGYTVSTWEISNPDTANETWVASRWALLEVSFVSVPADPTAMVRTVEIATEAPKTPSTTKETRSMPPENVPAQTVQPVAAPVAAPEARSQPQAAPQPVAMSARDTLEVLDFARSVGVEIETRSELEKDGMTKAAALEFVRGQVAQRQAKNTEAVAPHGTTAQITRDGGQTQRDAVVDFLHARLARTAPTGAASELRGLRVLDLIAARAGINSRDPMDIIQRAMHTTSDFPLLLEAAANKFLLTAYQVATPTYRGLAARRNFNDFKPHKFLRLGDFPALQDVNEGGEIKNGSFGENRESVTASTKGIIVPLSRQMLINDDLGAFSDLVRGAGLEAARKENELFYALLALNSAAGPTMSDAVAMFAAGHGNLAGSGAAITVASLSVGRAAMRKQKGVGGVQPLNIGPSRILVGPDKETEAQQLISPIQAQSAGNVNPFSGLLEIVTDANISGNAWYLFADPEMSPTFIYGYLNDASGPMITQEAPFNVDGLALRVLHDFGVGAVDYRGAYKNPGA